jgi:hypothetical protein
MEYAAEIILRVIIHMLSFMMTGAGVQEIRFHLCNLRGSNVGITDGKIYELRR